MPDHYLERRSIQWVVELKPKGEFSDAKRIPLEQYWAPTQPTTKAFKEYAKDLSTWLALFRS